ncbi:hypothetical protein SAPIO_CDS3988 [Scedosporium apiospermum]|uniref:CS domain-containing protein n=1 Tax=Pseudallescheria apiosperma TaxID=563466 RepID=A0A084G917_PSEDA|nr:uncharacterized protein SAPIO_CDS3988 [Scedosporium apiospermum]KEZ43829.1 hypothetical protein SAPIO_CDS3988 [Scedosporium apiospermum]
MAEAQLTPEVTWAQRSSSSDPEKNFVYLTIVVPDVPQDNLKLDIKDQGLTFTGRSDSLKKTYHLELELYGVIDPDKTKVHHTGMKIEIKLQKKELKEEYWPRLLKDSKKVHFLKTDFDRWVDEDEQDEAADEDFSKFGDMAGMPGMGGMGGDFGNIDFSQLGGALGGGAGAGADDDDDDDDDDMPPLEGEDEAKDEPKADKPADK